MGAYFTSTPTSPLRSLTIFDVASRTPDTFEMAYDLTSTFFDPGGASSPTIVAASDARKTPLYAFAFGMGVRCDSSFFHRVTRRALKPQICDRPGRYRSDLNGMAASTVHPPSNRPTSTSQIVFQSRLHRSLVICPSV